jgi:lysophospholipase L1-like esterase
LVSVKEDSFVAIKEPNKVILHVGTNDLKHLSAKRVAEGIANPATQIEEDSPATSIVISSILPRSDKSELSAKATEANKLIKAICSKNQWAFINQLICLA